jgi:hypothetical protein
MKKLIVVLLAFIIACDSGKEKKSKEAPISPEAKKELLGIIHGGWVKQEYVDSIIKTKSPYKSHKHYMSNVELIIDTTNVIGDTIMNPGCSTNGKESYYFKIVLKYDSLNKPSMLMLYNHNYMNKDFFLEYAISHKDTILYMIKKDLNNGEVINKIPYKKIYYSPPENDYSIDPTTIFLNRILITGKYKLYNAKNELISNQVEFKEEGKVEGFPGYKKYYLECYYGNAGNCNYNFDYIVFPSSEKRSAFRWTFDKGIFKFYDVMPDAQSATIGTKRFTLEKNDIEMY